ncbi:MAG: LysM peptidoglycan-binding domain-containing protein [Ferruginibacter sp.]
MKNFIILLIIIPVFAIAQTSYTSHTVAAKESLYSLARKYNIHPRELAAYNNIPVETPLSLGQVIRIPSKTTMAPLPSTVNPEKTVEVDKTVNEPKPVSEKKPAPVVSSEGSFPIYHKVEKKETLYHISKLYPGVTITDIKKWNKLTTDGLSEGTDLIVGYSKSGNSTTKAPVEKEPVETITVVTKAPEPAKKQPETVAPIETKKEVPVKDEVKSVTGKYFNGGAFKGLYNEQSTAKKNITEEKGKGGIFKSTSGWEDGKYYCLTNTAPAGTIVKVTNNTTQRTVYAKVLDLIPDLKQNSGVIIRISNSAAEELGATDNFDCTLNF